MVQDHPDNDDRGTLLSFPAPRPEPDAADFGEDILPRLRRRSRPRELRLRSTPGPPWAQGYIRAAWLALFAVIVAIGTATVFWPDSDESVAVVSSVGAGAEVEAADTTVEESATQAPASTDAEAEAEEPLPASDDAGAASQDAGATAPAGQRDATTDDVVADEGAPTVAEDGTEPAQSAAEPEATSEEADAAEGSVVDEAVAAPEEGATPEEPAAGGSGDSPSAPTEPASESESLSVHEWPRTVPYTVRPGDRVNRLAERFVTTEEALIELNGLTDPANLILGTVLLAPVGFPDSPNVAPPIDLFGPETFDILWDHYEFVTVVSGDTLAKIAARFDTTASTIAVLNGFEPSQPIVVGQELRVAVGYIPPVS